ncbi:MAG: hypothetical protein HS113_04470 [Verrucomicrobiales bacterium]|nr:hypothetical protein [Verrucomicrobiales bacterium]
MALPTARGNCASTPSIRQHLLGSPRSNCLLPMRVEQIPMPASVVAPPGFRRFISRNICLRACFAGPFARLHHRDALLVHRPQKSAPGAGIRV